MIGAEYNSFHNNGEFRVTNVGDVVVYSRSPLTIHYEKITTNLGIAQLVSR